MMDKMTSKTSSLKALLLTAWSERWSDLEWGIQIKTILPRGVSGDVYNLADIILQQALVGPGPNQLILSYLKHNLSSQLVSYAAVIQRISKFDAFHKSYCVLCLLNLLENIEDGITCRTKQEEALLPTSILSLVGWLLNCFSYYKKNPCDFPDLTKKPIIILNRIMLNSFKAALIYLAKHNAEDDYNSIIAKSQELQKYLLEENNLEEINLLQKIEKLDINSFQLPNKKESFLDYSVQAMLKLIVILNPAVNSETIVNNLITIQLLKGYNNSRLYMELIRACFRNLNDSVQEECSTYWCVFTFIKLPLIIQLLTSHYSRDETKAKEASEEVVEGFMLVMEFCALLNNIDTQTQNHIMQYLLAEIVNISIISETDRDKILEARKLNSIDAGKMSTLVPELPMKPINNLISMTMPVLGKIMKSLDTDKIDKISGVFTRFAGGNNSEVISTYAAVKGDLPYFVDQLIKFNELSTQIDEKDPVGKSGIFDLTFLMLCSIAQDYGSQVILSNNNKRNSFFEKWVQHCLKEYNLNKAMIALDKEYDKDKLDKLIECFKSGEFDLNNPVMKWDEMCFSMPAIMKDIFQKWQNAAYSVDDVKRIISGITSQMCCLSICSVSWISSYMQILPDDQLLKCRQIIQLFISMTEQKARVPSESECGQSDLYPNRCLMSTFILRRMLNDSNLPGTAAAVVPPLSRGIVLKDPIYKQLIPVWEIVLQKGCLTSEAAHLFKIVITVNGTKLFMKFMLQEIVRIRLEEELNKAIDLLFALFYFNIQEFTIAILNHIPRLLFKANKQELVEPQSTAIAKLTAYVICAAVREEINSRKPNEDHLESDSIEDGAELCSPSKIMRMSSVDTGPTPIIFPINGGYSGSSQNVSIKNVPLLKSISTLLRAFDSVAGQTGVVNSDTYFVFNVLKQIIECGKEIAKPILSGLSSSTIPNLMRSIPDLFTMELILQLYNLNSAAGIKTAVRDLCLLRNLTLKS